LIEKLAYSTSRGGHGIERLRVWLNDRTPAVKATLSRHPHLSQLAKLAKQFFAPPGPAGLPVNVGLASAQPLRLPAVFSDHMVLQHGCPIPVWGIAENDELITVTFAGARVQTRAREGCWSLELPPLPPGGPHLLTVAGRETVVFRDVLVGDVWLCSGQSNMEWPLARCPDADAEIRAAENPQLRLFLVPLNKAAEPAVDVNARWERCTTESVRRFSAVGYYFARSIERGIPIGLVQSALGGSPIECWMARETLAASERFQREVLDPYPEQRRTFEQEVAFWEEEKRSLEAQGQTQTRPRPWWDWPPCSLFNGMLAPLLPYGIRGVLWYQGESNVDRADLYRELLAALISSWREQWRSPELPFLLVQIAGWDKNRWRSLEEIGARPEESDWAELREVQWTIARQTPNVAMVVTTDVGEKDDIHPTRKRPVGERLALAARELVYGESVVASGPALSGVAFQGDRAELSFEHVGGGLVSKGPLRGFAVCAADGAFVWAPASIEGERVVVRHPQGGPIEAVRYGWADFPLGNLFNREGLPALPFRVRREEQPGIRLQA